MIKATHSAGTSNSSPATNTMKAVVQHAYGGPDVLGLERVARPAITDDEVLVRVRAAAVNHADLVYVTGYPLIARAAFGLRAPKTLVRGKAFAGEVEAVGRNVTDFRRGEKVYAEVDSGAFAEYVSVPAAVLARSPKNLSFEQAATVPVSATTALQGLRDAGKVRPGQRVLINGASGGVGSFAVQIAKALGAEVTAVASTRNIELVRSLGADHVIDYTQRNFTKGADRFEVIFDLVGNHSLTELRRTLTRKGTLVLSSGTGGRVLGPMGRMLQAVVTSPFISQKFSLFSASISAEALDAVRELIESGKVTPAIDATFDVGDAANAARYFVEEHARGKIVISMQELGK